MIFCGFVVLLSAIVADFGAGLFPGFSLRPIGGESWIALLQDVFAVCHRGRHRAGRVAPLRAAPGALRRLQDGRRDDHLRLRSGDRGIDADRGRRRHRRRHRAWRLAAGERRPRHALTGAGLTPQGAAGLRAGATWVHMLAILGFLAYIPGSKHRHMFTAIPNIFFRSLAPRGVLPPPPPERGQVGISADRAVHLEGRARLRLLHRVRPLPSGVPRLRLRPAAQPEAVDHGPAR